MVETQDVQIDVLTGINPPTLIIEKEVVDFLHQHLEQYGDPPHHIAKAIEYASSSHAGKGGYVITARKNNQILGAVVINKTGMSGYIPENILVYIAVDKSARGMGLGKRLMETAFANVSGDIALHVEPENPARRLYERLGFTNKYLEMRYSNNK